MQDDIKKVLAYSTISQLGYMVMALGVGAWTAGVFHLFTHAFFKALLFLGAGSVSHAVHSINMRDMGGLRKSHAHHVLDLHRSARSPSPASSRSPGSGRRTRSSSEPCGRHGNGYLFILVVGLVGAFMTAAYMTRCVYLTFFGEYRGHGQPHESPQAMTVPL